MEATSNRTLLHDMTPGGRLLWDTYDGVMRARFEHKPQVGLGPETMASAYKGPPGVADAMAGALNALGYTGPAGPAPPRQNAVVHTLGAALTPGKNVIHDRGPCKPPNLSIDRSTCRHDCLHEMVESGPGPCDDYIEECGTRRLTDGELDAYGAEFIGSSAEGFKQGPRIRDASVVEEQLVTAAWNLVLQNMDMVRWAVCKATGTIDDSKYKALLRRINGKTRITVKIWDIDPPGDGFALALDGSGTIVIWGGEGVWATYVDMWNNGASPNVRLCSALNLAAVLLHELCHLAGYTYIDLGNKCYDVYLIESAFKWAVFQRYPQAGNDPDAPTNSKGQPTNSCCNQFDEDWVFGCGASYAPQTDCTTVSGGGSSSGYYAGGGGILDDIWWFGKSFVGAAFGLWWKYQEFKWKVATWVVSKALDAAKWVAEKAWEGLTWAWETTKDAAEWVWNQIKKGLAWLFGSDSTSSGGGCLDLCVECPEWCAKDCVTWIGTEEQMFECALRMTESDMEEAEEIRSTYGP